MSSQHIIILLSGTACSPLKRCSPSLSGGMFWCGVRNVFEALVNASDLPQSRRWCHHNTWSFFPSSNLPKTQLWWPLSHYKLRSALEWNTQQCQLKTSLIDCNSRSSSDQGYICLITLFVTHVLHDRLRLWIRWTKKFGSFWFKFCKFCRRYLFFMYEYNWYDTIFYGISEP